MITHNITLDVVPGEVGKEGVVINLSQNDTDYGLIFTLTAWTGDLTIPDNATGVLRGTRKDGGTYSLQAYRQAGDNLKWLVTGSKDMTCAAGNGSAELVISSKWEGETEPRELHTSNFVVAVEKSPVEEA